MVHSSVSFASSILVVCLVTISSCTLHTHASTAPFFLCRFWISPPIRTTKTTVVHNHRWGIGDGNGDDATPSPVLSWVSTSSSSVCLIGFVVVSRKAVAPALLVATKFVGERSVVAAKGTIEFATRFPAFLRYLLFHVLLNENHACFQARTTSGVAIPYEASNPYRRRRRLSNDDDDRSRRRVYRGVVLTPACRALLYVASAWIGTGVGGFHDGGVGGGGGNDGGGWTRRAIRSVVSRYAYGRKLFAFGACARALQLCTGAQRLFDPGLGVAAVLNAGAVWSGSRWTRNFVNGWVLSGEMWRVVGAEKPEDGNEKEATRQ